MEDNSKNIDHLFREELGSYTEAPPPAAWDALEQRLAAKPPARPPYAFRRIGYIAMLTLVVVSTAVIVAHKATDDTATQPILAQEKQPTDIRDAAPMPATTTINKELQHTDITTKAAQKPTSPNAEKQPVAIAVTTATQPAATTAKNIPATAHIPVTNNSATTQTVTAPQNNVHKTITNRTTAIITQPHNNPTASYASSAAPHGTAHSLPAPADTDGDEPTINAPVTTRTTQQARTKTTIRAIAARNKVLAAAAPKAIAAPHSTAHRLAAKPIVFNAAKAVPAKKLAARHPAAHTTGRRQGVSIAPLSTGLRYIGITNTHAITKEKTRPQFNELVYNYSLNAAPAEHYGNGGIQQQETPAQDTKQQAAQGIKTTPTTKQQFDRFEAGIKAGYERGFNNDAATKFLAAPYLQYNLSPKLAIMLQPAVKAAKIASRSIGTSQSYYKVNNDGTTHLADSTPLYVPTGLSVDTMWLRSYSYSQTHDSIIKSNTYGGTYIEAELPILLKYYISPKFAVYGGANITYGKLTGVTEHTYTSNPITQTGSAITVAQQYIPAPAPAALSKVITYTGTSFDAYSGPQYPANNKATLRLGYMAGFSYEFADRWLLDGLLQQGIANPDVRAGYNINTAISSAYFRFTIGYKLTR